MKNTRDSFLVGFVITVAVILAVVGSLWLARGGLTKGYPLYADFEWGAGLKTGAPVWVSGANVGYVSNVEFRPMGSLYTELRITSAQPIPRGSPAAVVPNGLFGDVAVNFTPIRTRVGYRPGDVVATSPASPGLSGLTSKADSISTAVNALALALHKELVAGGGIADLRKTLAGTNKLMAQLSQIAAIQSRELSLTLADVRRTTSAIDSAKIDSTMTNFRAASANLALLTTSLDSTSRQLNQLVAKVGNGTGTAGKLLNDPAMYNDIRNLIGRLDSLAADVKAHPKRYINIKLF